MLLSSWRSLHDIPFASEIGYGLDRIQGMPFPFFFGVILSVFFRTALLLSVSGKHLHFFAVLKRTGSRIIPLFLLEILTVLSIMLCVLLFLFPAEAIYDDLYSETLRLVGATLLLALASIIVFSRTFAFLYIALSDERLFSGISLGYALFRKRMVSSMLFGALSVTVIMFTTVILHVAIRFFVREPRLLSDSAGLILFILSCLVIHEIVQSRAWVRFFRFLAGPKSSDRIVETSQESEKMIQREVPETGRA